MHSPASWHTIVVGIFGVCAAASAGSFLYALWWHTRLYRLLARYGSSVRPDADRDPGTDASRQTSGQTPLMRYVQTKQFVHEARPELRAAGEQAYRGMRALKWITVPTGVVAMFLLVFFIGPA